MKMNNRFIYGILSIALAAVIAFIAIPAVTSKTSSTCGIVRMKNAVPRGTLITADDVELAEVGGFNLPDSVARQTQDVIGIYAATDLFPGDYILPEKVSSVPLSSDLSLNGIPDGMLNANMTSTINTLKMKVPNRIFHEWCNTLIQCQSDRSMKNTLTFTVQKFSDMRIIQSELEAIINEPKKEAITMMFLVVGNIPLLYVLNRSWFETLMFSLPGKITLAICVAIVLFSFTRIMQLSKPIEYRA